MASDDNSVELMTREEAKRILRRLELDAYSAVVTAFRAQGDISKGKKALLHELSNNLSISTERHRAEVRRVVNDDRLNAVAGCMHGSGTATEWSIEGRRLVSLMPRLVPQTVFTAKATAAANQAVEANQKLPIKTEIDVLPLQIKQKSIPPKCKEKSSDMKDMKQKFSLDNSSLLKSESKKKKKANILYSKPSPSTLNKSSITPSKHSLAAVTSSLRPLIKNSVAALKCSLATYSPSKSITTAMSSLKYSQKPIILQRSPMKSQPSTRSTSLSTSTSTVNIPLSTLSSLVPNKTDSTSTQLVQSPLIKVVSNSLLTSVSNSISLNTSLQSSITQKIKFKTPLPKSKVKPKFKPMVPVQRPNLLLNVSSAESGLYGLNSAASTSPIKTVISGQSMSVKVVQVAKSSTALASPSGAVCASSLLSTINRPVVVVSSNNSNKMTAVSAQRVVTFNNITAATSFSSLQQTKLAVSSQLASSVSSTVTKSTLSAKSMPLATGFKMIAVTTVVPGTTQVKTVYIATPIMSLTKTMSHTNGGLITAASSGLKQPASIASPLHSMGRSLTSAKISNSFSIGTLENTIATPSIAVGKSLKLSTSKGVGHLKSALSSGTPQSLKVFTSSISKAKTPYIVGNSAIKNSPLLPSTSLLTSVVGQQQHFRQIKMVDNNIPIKTDKQLSSNANMIANSYLNLNAMNSGKTMNHQAKQNTAHTPQSSLPTTTLILNNHDDVSSTLHLLDQQDSIITTEQITASATADTDDLAFFSAGEKFLEQLSAKMAAASPDSLSKKEQFMFPIELENSISSPNNQRLFDLNSKQSHFEIGSASPSVSTNDLPSNSNHSKHVMQIKQTKESGHLIIPKSLTTNLVSSKLSNNILNHNNNMTIVNQKLNLPPNTLQITKQQKLHQMIHPGSSQLHHSPQHGSITLAKPVRFNLSKSDSMSKNPLSYSNSSIQSNINISKPAEFTAKSTNELFNVQPSQQVSFNNVGSNTMESNSINSFIKMSSNNLPHGKNKLQMTIPAPSKLNISPVLVNNSENLLLNSSSSNQVKIHPSPFSQIPSTINPAIKNSVPSPSSSSSMLAHTHNYTILRNSSSSVSNNENLVSTSSNNENTIPLAKIISINNQSGKNSQTFTRNLISQTSTELDNSLTDNSKKRKFNCVNPGNEASILAILPTTPRTQASWIRGASNLLQRVSRVRGTNKQKGEMNAASWFTKPVDPNDAPGYYQVIQTPMDFGKIKRKLEEGEYCSYPSFYDDMMLIKKNCYTYNPEGHVARKDCDDVFSFFENEYKKLLDRWEKHHVSPHKKSKLSTDVI